MPSLEEIALDVAVVYYIEKDAKETKEELRSELFEMVAASFAREDLAQKTVQIPDSVPSSESFDYALRYNPGWRLADGQEESRSVLIEEDPDFKQWSVVVPIEVATGKVDKNDEPIMAPGYVVTKTIASGSVLIDDELMKRENHALYLDVTRPRGFNWIADMLYHKGVESEDVDEAITEWMPDDWPVELRDDLTPEEIEEIKPYTYEGPKQKRLNVRYAKNDEIENG